MKPLTKAALEAELHHALDHGDVDEAMRLADAIDHLDYARPVTMASAALFYVQLGLPVFPLPPGSKVPYPHSRGVKDATTDPDRVWEWWEQAHPEANIGIATGHRVDVIDFDGAGAHAAWGLKYGEDWADAGVQVLGTVATPRPGGLHIYVPATGKGNRANVAGMAGVDYRGLGGYVVAPPSTTDLGTYRWLRPLEVRA